MFSTLIMGKRHAYATLFYESDCYKSRKVGIEVLLNSILSTNTNADVLLVTSKNINNSCLRNFLSMKIYIKAVDMIDPFNGQKLTYPPHFQHHLNRLVLFNFLQYDRIVYFEPYTLVLYNMDIIFTCGYFCAVDQQPLVILLIIIDA